MATPRIAPVWLIGLSGAPFGFYGGVLFYAVPQLLAALGYDVDLAGGHLVVNEEEAERVPVRIGLPS